MTAQEIINGLSDTLLCDERILSEPERELLANLLRRAKTQANVPGNAVAETIASAVGEVIAERAYGILGDSIVQRLLQEPASSSGWPSRTTRVIWAGSPPVTPPGPDVGPRPPSPSPPGGGPSITIRAGSPPVTPPGPDVGPRPPSPSPPGGGPSITIRAGSPPVTPSGPGGGPDVGPRPPSPSPPGPSIAARAIQASASAIAVMEAPEVLPARPVIFGEFLAPAELDALMRYTSERETEFQVSEVLSPGVTGGAVDYEQRRSRVLMDLGQHKDVIVDRLKGSFPRILQKLEHDTFPISWVEAQITASNHGDFFRWHSDNAQEQVTSREITFVYFFHREPKRFRGGELRIYDSRRENNRYVPTANCHVIVPEQNQMVLFDSSLAHEITPVECSSGAFADSRFTVNGWLHK